MGSFTAFLLATGTGEALTEDIGLLTEIAAALAVGFGIVLMGLTDTEHPPAAGTALGLAVVDFNATLLLVLATSVVLWWPRSNCCYRVSATYCSGAEAGRR